MLCARSELTDAGWRSFTRGCARARGKGHALATVNTAAATVERAYRDYTVPGFTLPPLSNGTVSHGHRRRLAPTRALCSPPVQVQLHYNPWWYGFNLRFVLPVPPRLNHSLIGCLISLVLSHIRPALASTFDRRA